MHKRGSVQAFLVDAGEVLRPLALARTQLLQLRMLVHPVDAPARRDDGPRLQAVGGVDDERQFVDGAQLDDTSGALAGANCSGVLGAN